ncbi:2-dehydropantoate 2-reductase [Malassezia sp. CBS 17886]|nr:2-dehydropantoate 2-reductase [Malassezia sp. CBS 17886]
MAPPSVLVVGGGAVGCFYASRLAQSACRTALVCRSNYDAVKTGGVDMRTHSFGDYKYVPDDVFPSVDAAGGTPWDFVIVATKALSMDPEDARRLVGPTVHERTTLVIVQNGVLVEEPFRAAFPTAPIVSAVTIISAALTGASVVEQFRWTRISFGAYTDLQGDARTAEQRALRTRAEAGVKTLVALLSDGGVRDAEACDARALQFVRWHKLCINASMNVSGVLAGCLGNAEMVRDPALRAHIRACMYEVLAAATPIFGEALPDKFASPDAILRSTERNTGSKSSMVQDWELHRPLELDAILGNALRIAEEHDASMPRLQTMYALLQRAQDVRLDAHSGS